MRTFVAVDISDPSLIRQLSELQGQIVRAGADVKPVAESQLHFTLKFLGEVLESQAPQIVSRLSSIEASGFRIRFSGVGFFPDHRHPRVVWVGVDEEASSRMVQLAEEVERRLEDIFPREGRPFTPHLTVCRVRSERGKDSLMEVVRSRSGEFWGEDAVRSIALKKSTLTPRGPVYEDIHRFALRE